MKKPKVSIILPVFNEEKDIGECLNSLKKQVYKDFEIIVVDDGSVDRTKEIVKKFNNVKLIEGEHKGPGFSRNLGAKKAQGNILVFIDADMTFEKNYIANLTKPFFEDKTNNIIGTTHELEIVKNTKNIWSRCRGKIRVSKETAKDVKVFRAIRKDKFLELGGFDPKYGYADDQTFWFKYNLKPIVAKNTICFHKNPETLKQVYRQSRWIGASMDNWLFKLPVIRFFLLLFLFIISPIFIPILSFKRCFKINDINILPFMMLFMTARYFGTLNGILRKIYFNMNIR